MLSRPRSVIFFVGVEVTFQVRLLQFQINYQAETRLQFSNASDKVRAS